jgi:hypothetical protein
LARRIASRIFLLSFAPRLSHLKIGVDFTNKFTPSFCGCRSQKRKKTALTVFFTLLGSARAKAALKMLMILTLGVSFTKILRAAFFEKKGFAQLAQQGSTPLPKL